MINSTNAREVVCDTASTVVNKDQQKIFNKDYLLNEMEAIKKKLEFCTRNPGIEIISEAVDGHHCLNTSKLR